MDNIKYIRVDDRLVHGQIVAVWLQELKADVLLVIDDEAANNSMQRMMLQMSVPRSTEFELLDEEAGLKYIQDNPDKQIFLIVGNVYTIRNLISDGLDVEEVNIGNIGTSKERKRYSKAVWCTDDEVNVINEMINSGVVVNVHLVPSERKYSAEEIFK